jgi:hypothetical protein
MAFEESLSPAVQEQVTRQGARLHGFEKARDSLRDFGCDLNTKRIERQTERIGGERVAERAAVVEQFQQLTLVEKCSPPPGVTVPDVAAVSCDGGRLQTVDPSEKGTHWHQYLAADLRVLDSQMLAEDPEPALPEIFRDEQRMGRVVAGISHKIAGTEAPADPEDAARDHARESRVVDALLSEPAEHAAQRRSTTRRINQPRTIAREVLASRRQSAPKFGLTMAASAWALGLFVAARKAFVGDGQAANWEIWERQFKAYGFVAVLDFIHALTYVYNAALAGQTPAEGWRIYVRWITLVWHGRVADVLGELERRQQQLGAPQDSDGETHPRKIVAKSLTYLTNQQTRMNYPEYRRQGLPITSCHIESTIKQMNYRVKGTEMFWTDAGAEALLQLSADLLCDSQPLDQFWTRRAARMTGYRRYAHSVT